MDYGRILVFIPAIMYFLYRFLRHRKVFFLLCAIAGWLGLSYGGKHGLYYILEQPAKQYIGSISRFLLILVLILYMIQSFREIRE